MKPNTEQTQSRNGAQARKVHTPPNFDTLAVVRKLKDANFEDKQAMALVETLQDSQVALATKDDLAQLESNLRHEMVQMENRLRHDINRDINRDMDKKLWIFMGMTVTLISGIVAVLIGTLFYLQ